MIHECWFLGFELRLDAYTFRGYCGFLRILVPRPSTFGFIQWKKEFLVWVDNFHDVLFRRGKRLFHGEGPGDNAATPRADWLRRFYARHQDNLWLLHEFIHFSQSSRIR